MQRSAGREEEQEVGTRRAGHSTVDPRPAASNSHHGHSPLAADNLSSLLLLLFQT